MDKALQIPETPAAFGKLFAELGIVQVAWMRRFLAAAENGRMPRSSAYPMIPPRQRSSPPNRWPK